MIFGAAVLVVIALVIWLGRSSAHFRTEQEPFAEKFLADFSKRWAITDVYSRAGDPFIRQAQTPQGEGWLSRVGGLGQLKSIRESQFGGYVFGPNGQSGVFTFRAVFKNGEATVTITVAKEGETAKVMGFFITNGQLNDENRVSRSYRSAELLNGVAIRL